MPQVTRVGVLATTIEFGGIEKVLLTQVAAADTAVELVPVFFTRSQIADRTFFDKLDALGCTYRTVAVDRSRPAYINPIRNVADAIGELRGKGCHVVHAHGYRADLIGLAAATVLRLPIVSTCHGFIRNDAYLSAYARLDLRALRHFHGVIAVSDRMRDDLIASGVTAGRVSVVPNAVQVPDLAGSRARRCQVRARLGIAEGTIVFGYVGRLSEEKGVHHLISALVTNPPGGFDWRLLVVGDGPRRQELESEVQRSRVRDRISFVGFQSDTTGYYAAMDAFVLPSLTEGTPMALLEAMAQRVPAVASAVGGVPAVVTDGVNGLLVPPGEPARLAEALACLGSDAGRRAALAEAGFETVCNGYDVGTWTTRIRSVYQRAIEEYGRPA